MLLLCVTAISTRAQVTAIYFNSGSHELSNNERLKLDSIATLIKSTPGSTLKIEGHTDSIGSLSYNISLSGRRNKAVTDYLVSKKVDRSAISMEKFGETKPAADNSEDKRALNRRVVLSVILPHDNKSQVITGTEPKPVVPATEPKTEKPKVETLPNGVIVNYGSYGGGSISVDVVGNTSQMEAMNFTTETVDGESLTSNVMICPKINSNGKDCQLKVPIKIYTPINRDVACKPADVKYFDSEKDSATGKVKWKEIYSGMYTEMLNGQEYFVTEVWNICRPPCANFDCKTGTVPVVIRNKYPDIVIEDISLVYPNANALFPGHKDASGNWIAKIIPSNKQEAVVKITYLDAQKNVQSKKVELKALKHNRKENKFYLRKRDIV
jgi:hypothetical protein